MSAAKKSIGTIDFDKSDDELDPLIKSQRVLFVLRFLQLTNSAV